MRRPIVAWLEPLQRPLRIAQSWSLYGSGPNRIVRMEILVDDELWFRAGDPEHTFQKAFLRYRRIRPIAVHTCLDDSKHSQRLVEILADRVRAVKRGGLDVHDLFLLAQTATVVRLRRRRDAGDGVGRTTLSDVPSPPLRAPTPALQLDALHPHRERVSGRHAWLTLGFVLLATSLACGGLPTGSTCTAQGLYTVCTQQGGYEVCDDRLSEGMGIGANAAGDALGMCNDHMTNMVVLGNMDGRAGMKVSCQVVACQ